MMDYFSELWSALTHWVAGTNADWVELLMADVILVAAIALAVSFSKVLFQRLLR